MSTVDKITPADPRVVHRTKALSTGKTYHYLLAEPSTAPVATALLVHGFPDCSFGWRYQVPYLLSLGLRVVVPDMVGYCRTDSPAELSAFTLKAASADLAALIEEDVLANDVDKRVILGGHDWGGALVWRFALWRPDLLKGVFSVCTPYFPPKPEYTALEDFVKVVPNFSYQLQLGGPDVEAAVTSTREIESFLRGMHGGKTLDPALADRPIFNPTTGVDLDIVKSPYGVSVGPLESEEEAAHYTAEFSKSGVRGPLNWYRTTRLNWEEEQELVQQGRTRISVPSMMVAASKDIVLLPSMTNSMPNFFDNLLRKEVDASHWALWETPEATNEAIGEFVKSILDIKASI